MYDNLVHIKSTVCGAALHKRFCIERTRNFLLTLNEAKSIKLHMCLNKFLSGSHTEKFNLEQVDRYYVNGRLKYGNTLQNPFGGRL